MKLMLHHVKTFLKRQPVRVWAWIFGIWALLEAFCIWLRIGLSIEDVPLKFPMSVSIIELHLKYWPMLITFGVVVWLAVKLLRKMGSETLFFFGLLLIFSGNLIQGFDGAFLKPLGLHTQWNVQYFNEAANIKGSSTEWLAGFNENQQSLMMHSRTHPPFAVLLFRELSGGNELCGVCSPWPVISAWILAASLCVYVFFNIFCGLGIGKNHAKRFALILAAMPAFNIYSLICLDSMIFFLSLFFFAGIINIHLRGARLINISAVAISTVCINMLTFAGVFFIGVLLVLAIIWLVLYGKRGFLAALLISVALLAGVIVLLNLHYGYDHIRAFLTACKLENRTGGTLIQHVLLYTESRLEDICEILLCLGLVPLAMLLSAKNRRLKILNLRDKLNMLAMSGIFVLLAIFMGGAYKTGETARACMFIYPFIFLLMRNMRLCVLREIFICCAIQTGLMQLMASYNW